MKRFLLLIFLGSFIGCLRKDDSIELPTSDTLYQSWKLTEVSYDGQPTLPDQYITTVTFPRDGNFRKGLQKTNRWHYGPVAFEGTNTAIRFNWDTSAPDCGVSNCRLSPLWEGINWQIKTLTNERLVLLGDKIKLVFEPVS